MVSIVNLSRQSAAALLLLLHTVGLIAQDRVATDSEFHFTRLAFGVYGRTPTNNPDEPWLRDWPDAEDHLLQGVKRLTLLNIGESRQASLLDDSIFEYPVAYAVKVGYWELSREEVDRLREYLVRGGFLIVDDFHGPEQWAQFMASIQRVFPGRAFVEIPDNHEIFHVHFDLDDRKQIPGAQAILNGVTMEHRLGVPEYWRGIYDDAGRLVVAINFNMDMGDAWEHADDAFYPEPLTALAYRVGINYIIYSMTH